MRFVQRMVALLALLLPAGFALGDEPMGIYDRALEAHRRQLVEFTHDLEGLGTPWRAKATQMREALNLPQSAPPTFEDYLRSGMHRHADEALRLRRARSSDARDADWLRLAGFRFRRGLFEAAEEALLQAASATRPDLRREYIRLQTELWLAQRRYEQAAQMLGSEEVRAWQDPYLTYNLGIALVGRKRLDDALNVWKPLMHRYEPLEETLALRDIANLRAGEQLLNRNDAAAAIVALRRVRLEGPYSAAALMALGDALGRRGDWPAALGAWRALNDRSSSRARVPEASLRFAAGLEQLGDLPAALDAYRSTETFCSREQVRLSQALKRLERGDWLAAAFLTRPEGEVATLLSELYDVAAGDAFQQAWQDLVMLRAAEQTLRRIDTALEPTSSTTQLTTVNARIGALREETQRLKGEVETRLQSTVSSAMAQRVARAQGCHDQALYAQARLLDARASKGVR